MSWFRSSKRPQDRPLDPAPSRHPERDNAGTRKEDPLLSLQRASGNQAVQKLLEQIRGDAIPEGERKELERLASERIYTKSASIAMRKRAVSPPARKPAPSPPAEISISHPERTRQRL